MSRFGRPRLLPATIAVGAALLATKTFGVAMAFMPVPEAQAATTPAAPPAAHPVPAAAVAVPAPPPAAPLPALEPSAPATPAVSEAERQVLQELRARRKELDAREQALAQREDVLAAAEQRMEARVTQLSALQTRLEQLDHDRLAHDEANWAGLVKVYETMKPRDAAAIFNDMDLAVLLPVVDRMKEAKTAAILGMMQPDRARLVTAKLAAQRTQAIAVPDHPDAG